ncbi:MAG: anaerobic ribonucleoside-triphosphate reductase activating protein [Candidatus ainarchaeum sp.]|nr:anaerobic ribonucleoside-triphosphate reductase activating protein [Candidatus ainarchaeum sp.]
MELRVGAIEKFSTIDYPDKISCAIFLKGCNFFCGFCYNKQLVCKELLESTPDLPLKDIQDFLDKRVGLIDAVVISGGEPTIYGDSLISFIKDIRSKGYLIKLDTNGSNPEILEKLISQKLIDYVAMDLKDSFENYSKYTLIPIENIKKSVNIIKNSKIDHEFRVTTHPELSLENFNILLNYVSEQKVFVQDFVNNNTIKTYADDSKTIYSQLSKEDKRYILR